MAIPDAIRYGPAEISSAIFSSVCRAVHPAEQEHPSGQPVVFMAIILLFINIIIINEKRRVWKEPA